MSSAVVCTVTHVYMHRLTHVYTVYGYYNYTVHVMPLICTSRDVKYVALRVPTQLLLLTTERPNLRKVSGLRRM